jgi:hypothetical protein
MQMVVVLTCIVEERRVLAERALHDIFKGLAFEFGALQQVVAVGHISLMMLVMVKFERLLGHMRLERVISIRQGWEREGHGSISGNCG